MTSATRRANACRSCSRAPASVRGARARSSSPTGRVTVDGEVARLGDASIPSTQRIALDGVPVVVRDDLVYYLLNKPVGLRERPRATRRVAPTVLDLVPADPRVFPVGRLDYDTEGLLLLTNDGELTQLLTHPSHGVVKTYLAEVEGVPDTRRARARCATASSSTTGSTAPARVRLVQRRGASAAVELGIHEGRNRQVRRMCDAVGHPVLRLVRTRIGPVCRPAARTGRVARAAPGRGARALRGGDARSAANGNRAPTEAPG